MNKRLAIGLCAVELTTQTEPGTLTVKQYIFNPRKLIFDHAPPLLSVL